MNTNTNEITETQRRDVATFLYKICHLIGRAGFVPMLMMDRYRFDGDGKPLFKKLRREFVFQLLQCFDADDAISKQSYDSPEHVLYGDALFHIRRYLEAVADQIMTGRKPVAKRLRSVRARSDRELFKITWKLLGQGRAREMARQLVVLEEPLRGPYTGRARQFLAALEDLIESQHTLAFDTGFADYEKMLSKLVSNLDYMVRGYPHDVLSHDVTSLRQGLPVKGIFTRKEWCTSFVQLVGEKFSDRLNRGGYEFHPMAG